MVSLRNVHFRNDYIYHVFNRGVERRHIFTSRRDYGRFELLLDYYRFNDITKSFSHYLNLSLEERKTYRESMNTLPVAVDILSYCFMPNHFHLILKQRVDRGIQKTLSNISNSYAKYFNIKYHRVGPLFQGPFKAVLVETDQQLIHLSRYIHLNPLVSAVIELKELSEYPWSSLPVYLGDTTASFVDTQQVLGYFRNPTVYKEFVYNQISYAKELEKIKHFLIEEV